MKHLWTPTAGLILLLALQACSSPTSGEVQEQYNEVMNQAQALQDSMSASITESVKDIKAWKKEFSFQKFKPDSADAVVNRIHFELLTGLECAQHIYEVYAWGDQMPPDQKFQLSFKCGPEVIVAMLDSLDLQPLLDKGAVKGKSLMQAFPWWKTSDLEHLKPFGKETGDRIQMLWYNDQTRQAYFHEFDL